MLGHYGNRNLGDESIIAAVIENIRLRFPRASIVCFSIDPADTRQRHGVTCFPVLSSGERSPGAGSSGVAPSPPAGSGTSNDSALRERLKQVPGLRTSVGVLRRLAELPGIMVHEWRFARVSRQRLAGLDLLIVAGSNQFLDNFGGLWRFPYSVLRWSILAKTCGAPVAFMSVGAGPLFSPWSRLFVRLALRCGEYASFRDDASRALVRRRWAGPSSRVAPDLALSLRPEAAIEPPSTGQAARPTVGINPMAVYDRRYWYVADDDKYASYVGKLAAFCSLLLDQDYPLFLFATQPKDEGVIVDVLNDLESRGYSDVRRLMRSTDSIDGLVELMRSADILVPTRFHGVVLSLYVARPTLGICYYRKSADLLADAGQGDFALDLETFTSQDLVERFRRLEEQRDARAAEIAARVAGYRERLQSQYDEVFGIVARSAESGAD